MSGYADVRWDFRKPGLVTEMSVCPQKRTSSGDDGRSEKCRQEPTLEPWMHEVLNDSIQVHRIGASA